MVNPASCKQGLHRRTMADKRTCHKGHKQNSLSNHPTQSGVSNYLTMRSRSSQLPSSQCKNCMPRTWRVIVQNCPKPMTLRVIVVSWCSPQPAAAHSCYTAEKVEATRTEIMCSLTLSHININVNSMVWWRCYAVAFNSFHNSLFLHCSFQKVPDSLGPGCLDQHSHQTSI